MKEYIKSPKQEVDIWYHPCEKGNSEYELAFEFINRIFREFAKGCLVHYKPRRGLIDMPYYYSERRFDSVVLPVLHKLCKGLVLTELPIERKKGKKVIGSGHGRVDYWCIYKGYTFIIEMKRTSDNIDGTTVRRNSMIERWQNMHDQLKSAEEDLKTFTEKTKGVIPIGLHFVTSRTFRENRCNEDAYQEYIDVCFDNMDAFRNALSEKYKGEPLIPDYSAAWIIPLDIALSSAEDNKMCPIVMLFGQIRNVIQHQGCK